MFEFLAMMGNYEQRKIARDDFEWGFVSTAAVTGGEKPYETAVEHKDYGDGSMVIVENYDSREMAIAGHAKWLANMTSSKLPEALIDCENSEWQKLCGKRVECLGNTSLN